MNVLMLSWEFPPKISGGLGVACFGLSRGLTGLKQNVRVTVVIPEASGHEDSRFADVYGIKEVVNGGKCSGSGRGARGATLARSGNTNEWTQRSASEDNTVSGRRRVRIGKKHAYSSGHKTGAQEFAARLGESSLLFREFDVIHAHDWLTFDAGLNIKAVTGRPLVAHVHSTEWDRAGESVDKDIVGIERRGMDGADRIVAVSNLTRLSLIERYAQNAEKIVTIYNGCENEGEYRWKQRTTDRKRVSFIGRITRQKSPESFLRAAYHIAQQRDDVEFVMAGDGDLRTMMIRMANTLGLDEVLTFPGFLRSEQVAALLRASDVYVMPSVSEPFGIGALEAINAGVPVVVSRHAGITEVIRSAHTIDWWDVDAQVEGIQSILDDPQRAESVAARCAHEAAGLSWRNAAERLLYQYGILLAAP